MNFSQNDERLDLSTNENLCTFGITNDTVPISFENICLSLTNPLLVETQSANLLTNLLMNSLEGFSSQIFNNLRNKSTLRMKPNKKQHVKRFFRSDTVAVQSFQLYW